MHTPLAALSISVALALVDLSLAAGCAPPAPAHTGAPAHAQPAVAPQDPSTQIDPNSPSAPPSDQRDPSVPPRNPTDPTDPNAPSAPPSDPNNPNNPNNPNDPSAPNNPNDPNAPSTPPPTPAPSGMVATLTPLVDGSGTELTADVTIAGVTFTAILDTGSTGLRILHGTVPDAALPATDLGNTTVTFGRAVFVDGAVKRAVVTIGDHTTNGPINIVDVTEVSCVADAPHCPAQNAAIPGFLFKRQFPAVLGVGMRGGLVSSPLAQMGNHRQYVLSVPPVGESTGTIAIDPSDDELARFGGDIFLNNIGTTAEGIERFDDMSVPFCMNDYCSYGLLDTGGAPGINDSGDWDDALLGVPDGSSEIPPGTDVVATIGDGAAWSFVVTPTPVLGVDLFHLRGGDAPNNLAITPFRIFDVLYDYDSGVIAFKSKQ